MRYVKGLLLGVCMVLTACGIGEQQRSKCASCNGPYLTIHLNPPVSENVVLELKRANQKNIEVKCEFFPRNFEPYGPLYSPPDYRDPSGYCDGEYVDKKDEESSKIKYELVNVNKISIGFASIYSDKPFDFANEVDVSLKTQAGQMLTQQSFTLNYEVFNQCGNGFPHCSQAEITLNLTTPDAETNNQEGAQ